MTGAVFDRGRSGSDEVWRAPTMLARHADASSVPIRECLADVFKEAHVENHDPLDAVDADEIDEVYESLARSERIVGGYTRFGFEEKGAMRVYCTADPDAVEQEPVEPAQTVGVPFGNPLFRAEGELFDDGTNPVARPSLAARSLRSVETSSRVPASARSRASRTPHASRASTRLFTETSARNRPPPVAATAPRRGPPPGSATTLPRRPLFASTTRPRRPPSHARAFARAEPQPRGFRSHPSDSPPRAPTDSEKAALVEKIEAVLGEVRARIRGGAGSVSSTPAKTTNLGARFAAVSRDRTAERAARRRAATLEALVRPALARWRSAATRASAEREQALFAKAIAAFASTSARAAFSRWVRRVDERNDRRELFRRATSWWKARSKTAAWLRWRDAVVDAQTARWAARFYVDRARSAAFARWAEFADEAAGARRVATRAAAFESKTRAAVVATWRAFARERSAEVATQTRHALSHWTHRTAARAWARWCVFGDEHRAATRLDAEAFRFFRRRALARGLVTWRERALEQMLVREEWCLAEERHRRTALRRFADRWIARVRETVAAETADEHRARVVAGACLSAWFREMWVSHLRRENAARRCVRAWHRVAAARRVTRACLSAARHRRDTRATRAAFDAWSAMWLREARATLGAALAARNAARRATRTWREAASASSLARRAGDAADRHARARLAARAFAALSSHWARRVLTRAFVYGQQKKLAARAWSGWASEAWERRLRRVEDELGAVEALGHGGFDVRRAASSKGSPTRGFSMSRSPPGGPWLAAGPGKNSKAPIGDADKWKFY